MFASNAGLHRRSAVIMAGRKAILVHDGDGTPVLESRNRTHDPTGISPTCPDLFSAIQLPKDDSLILEYCHMLMVRTVVAYAKDAVINRHWINNYLYVLDVTDVYKQRRSDRMDHNGPNKSGSKN